MSLQTLIDALALLTPYDLVDERKVRIGHPTRDGGYVMLDRFGAGQPVYSFGIGRNVSFDRDVADRGHEVFMFDHTIDGLPEEHANFRFSREGIAGSTDAAQHLYSLADHLARRGHLGRQLILKMDVEGYEWRVLDETPTEVLAQFEQIAFEAHRLERIGFREGGERMVRALAKLNSTHTLFHVHANNYRPPEMVHGLPVPHLMELSYVRSDLVQRRSNATIYPTALDRPNSGERVDLPLLFYPFMPVTAPLAADAPMADQLRDCAARLDEEAKRVAHRTRQRLRAAQQAAN